MRIVIKTGGYCEKNNDFAFKTGQKLEKHKTGTPAFLFVHQGQIEFSMEGKIHNLEAGSFFNIPINIEHELLAKKDSKAFLIK